MLTATTVAGAEAAAPRFAKNSASPAAKAITSLAKAPIAKTGVKGDRYGFEFAKARQLSKPGTQIAVANVKAPYKVFNPSSLPKSKAPADVVAGNVIFADSWANLPEGESAPVGLYYVPTSEGADFESMEIATSSNSYSGTVVDGVYYFNELFTLWGTIFASNLYGIDLESGEVVYAAEIGLDCQSISMDYNAADGKIYGVFYNADGSAYNFGALDIKGATPTMEVIASGVKPVVAFNFDAQGQAWAVTKDYDPNVGVTGAHLAKVDITTGEFTEIGTTGFIPQYISGGTINPNSGTYYVSVATDAGGYLTTIDFETGEASLVCEFADGQEVIGLFTPAALAADNAPAAVTDLTAAFTDGSLEGTVSFAVPTTLYDGTAASGAVTYHVTANGTEVATGSTTYGANVEANVTIPAPGNYKLVAYVSNENGDGPKTNIKMYIGDDVVEAPQNVVASYADGVITISWDAVTEGINGGFVNPAEVTYNVVMTEPEVELVAQNISETSCTYEVGTVEDLTRFQFDVIAKYAGNYSQETSSNPILLGNIVLPYSQTFDAATALDEMIVIDANGDGRTWTFDNGAVKVQYNGAMAMDDWLMTPTVKLEAGKAYDFTFKTKGQSTYYVERFEVKMGNAATPEAMTTTLIEPTDVTWTDFEEFVATIVPEETGEYSIGIHGCSETDQFYLWVDDIAISAGFSPNSPAVVTDLAAASDPNGALEVTVSFNAPAVNVAGTAISEITKIEVTNDGELVKTFEGVAPGAACSFVDPTTEGFHTYSVVAYNEDGAGRATKTTAYCGVNTPGDMGAVAIVETANEGEVTLSWEAITTDVEGNAINPDLVKYNVYKANGSARELVEEGVEGTSYTCQAVPAGDQQFVQYIVFGVTNRGEGAGQYSDMIPAGTPYYGMRESFADGTLSYIWGMSTAGGGSVALYTDASGIVSQDSDNGFIGISAQYLDQYAELFTGKITIPQSEDAGISLYNYCISEEDINEFELYIRECGDEEYTLLDSYVVNEIGEAETWNLVIIPLPEYAGKTVQVKIIGTAKKYATTAFDNIKVGALVANDLAATKIIAPAKVNTGADYNVSVVVANEGTQPATAFRVELYADGDNADAVEIEGLEVGESKVVTFARHMSALAEEEVIYGAAVVYDKDENWENDSPAKVTVTPKVSTLPVAEDVNAAIDGDAVLVTWTEPDLSAGVAETKFEDFEEGESWAHEFEGWTFVDVDDSEVGGFQDISIPGLVAGTDKAAFFVFDNTEDTFNQSFDAVSGNKYLAAMFRYDDGQSDDWAISPALSGAAQTISFCARSYSSAYPEKIEMYYSTGSLEPADFVMVDAIAQVPAEWSEVEFDVPEGAVYFAIRSCATGSFMLMLDDFTFEAGSSSSTLSILGYNIYRDGEKINEEIVEECSFVDNYMPTATTEYRITTVYDRGESAGSQPAYVDPSALNAITGNGVAVKAVKGQIIVKGAEGAQVTINTVEGKAVYSAMGTNSMAIDVTAGVYVVTVGRQVAKVLVR